MADVDHMKKMFLEMNDLRNNNKYTDVIIQSSGKEIACHKVVLASATPYFSAMFDSGMLEAQSGKVDFDSFPIEIIENIVRFIYTSYIYIEKENVQDLVNMSSLLQLDELKKKCELFMIEQLLPSVCVGYSKTADLFCLKKLQTRAREMMLGKLDEVIHCEEFLEMDIEDLSTYLSDDGLATVSEDCVLDAALKWIDHKEEERKHNTTMILTNLVRLPYCSSATLARVLKNRFILENVNCTTLIAEALGCQRSGNYSRPRRSYESKKKLVLIGGAACSNRALIVESYLLNDQNMWDTICNGHFENVYVSACSTPSGMIITGGCKPNGPDSSCYLYKFTDKTLKSLPNMNYARKKHCSIHHNGQVYVLGGLNQNPLKCVEKLCSDGLDFKWVNVKDMLAPRSSALAVSCNGSLYVMSGWANFQGTRVWSNSTQMYDQLWNKWTMKRPMPSICQGGAAVALNDNIYVVGGRECICLKYVCTTDTWITLTRCRFKHRYCSAVVWNGRILVSGGQDTDNDTGIEEYDAATDTWGGSTIMLPQARFHHTMLAIDLQEEKRSLTDQ